MRASLGSVILPVLTQSTPHPPPSQIEEFVSNVQIQDVSHLSLCATFDFAPVLEVLVRMLLTVGDVFDLSFVVQNMLVAEHVFLQRY